MSVRVCKDCKEEKPISDFQVKKSTVRNCISCRRENDRWRNITRLYGVTKEEYIDLLNKQGGVCKLCDKTPEENGQALAVDHCHDTGKVRGLLCTMCNLMLGYSNDNISTLAKAIAYLNNDN